MIAYLGWVQSLPGNALACSAHSGKPPLFDPPTACARRAPQGLGHVFCRGFVSNEWVQKGISGFLCGIKQGTLGRPTGGLFMRSRAKISASLQPRSKLFAVQLAPARRNGIANCDPTGRTPGSGKSFSPNYRCTGPVLGQGCLFQYPGNALK